MRIMILNGPNLNMLGIREPHIYGSTTLNAVKASCEEFAAFAGAQLSFHQSNHEGELVDLIQSARTKADALIINPAAYSFTSIAMFDAMKIFEGPIYEVHISNIHARDELHRSLLAVGPVGRGRPHEVAPDGAAQLQLVAAAQLVGEVRRHLAPVEALHRQVQLRDVRRRGDGVAALRLIAVLRGQANVNVLAGPVSRPCGWIEDDAPHPGGLVDHFDHGRDLPVQSPWYRCSRHGSP